MRQILNLIKWVLGKKIPVNSLHPELKRKIKPAAVLKDDNGQTIQLYEFESLDDMPARRFSALNDFIEDKNRGIEREELYNNLEEAIEGFNQNTINGVTNALVILKWMKSRMLIANDVDIVLRLLSCALFTEEEDLTKYDWDVGTWKIKLIEENGLSSFFLQKSIQKYWTPTPISKKDMETLLEQRRMKVQVLKELKEMGISVSNTYQESKK